MTEAPGTAVGFFHAGVTVSDMDQALRFYRDTLGLELVSDRYTDADYARRIWALAPERVRAAFLRVPGSDAMIELFEFQGIERHAASARPCDYGAGHFCLYVEDAEAVHARALRLGFSSRAGELVVIPDGPFAGAKVAYLIDGDGYHVEIFERASRQ